jgi:hypothetical protein
VDDLVWLAVSMLQGWAWRLWRDSRGRRTATGPGAGATVS